MAPAAEWEEVAWLEVVMKNWEEQRRIAAVTEVDGGNAGVKKGESYMSDMDRITAQAILGNGSRSRPLPLLLKRSLPLVNKKDTNTFRTNAFNNESWVYENVLRKYEEIIVGTPLTPLWPKCYYSSKSVIVMEDLKTQGYRVLDRRAGYSFDDAVLTSKSLARLHAMGVAASERGFVNPSALPSFPFLSKEFGKFFETLFSALATAMRSPPWEPEWGGEIADRVYKAGQVMSDKLNMLNKAEGPLRVICHGDSWLCNQLLRFDKDDKPVHTVFVDFQITNYSSFAWDIIYLTTTSLSKEVRLSGGVDTMIQEYATALRETLKTLNTKIVAPTLEQIRAEVERMSLYRFAVSMSLRPIMVCNPAIVLPSESFFHDAQACIPLYQDKALLPDLQIEINKAIKEGLI